MLIFSPKRFFCYSNILWLWGISALACSVTISDFGASCVVKLRMQSLSCRYIRSAYNFMLTEPGNSVSSPHRVCWRQSNQLRRIWIFETQSRYSAGTEKGQLTQYFIDSADCVTDLDTERGVEEDSHTFNLLDNFSSVTVVSAQLPRINVGSKHECTQLMTLTFACVISAGLNIKITPGRHVSETTTCSFWYLVNKPNDWNATWLILCSLFLGRYLF